MTLRVIIKNGNTKLNVKALIDTGSQLSYLSTRVIKDLKSNPKGKQHLMCSLFGERKTEPRLHEIYEINISDLKSHGACVLIRTVDYLEIKAQLVRVKARIAPMKEMTFPKLELMACSIGTRLAHSIKLAFDLQDIPITFWSDSMTPLWWIREHGEWSVFVSNRVKEIHRIVELLLGRDGKMRIVKVRTENGVFLPPIQRVYPFELHNKYLDSIFQVQGIAKSVAGTRDVSQTVAGVKKIAGALMDHRSVADIEDVPDPTGSSVGVKGASPVPQNLNKIPISIVTRSGRLIKRPQMF
ncbi:hypothetical protein AVEN_136271-1 [Araneus ventricosus]|uniref:Uncharacterized protein n=1 Tax=Araneus ventricosus TaxID=182803 RepID=A0A4Y2L6C4_ARAVE|nr:hypothetical protein AVEN_136271-1 [Araneus ventricosus]